MAYNPYSKYKEESVSTMTPGEMVVKLYDETVKQLTIASEAIAKKDYTAVNASLNKAQAIINHLVSTLNREIEISNSLLAMYDFWLKVIVTANIKKDATDLVEIIPMVQELRDAFSQSEKLARMGLGKK